MKISACNNTNRPHVLAQSRWSWPSSHSAFTCKGPGISTDGSIIQHMYRQLAPVAVMTPECHAIYEGDEWTSFDAICMPATRDGSSAIVERLRHLHEPEDMHDEEQGSA